MTAYPAIEVVGFGYTFPGRDTPSLEDVSFSLEPGSWTVVAGPTGSGKSTLLRALVGLIPRLARGTVEGAVWLFGRPIVEHGAAELARTIGFVQQSPDDQICATTVEAELAFGLENLQLPVAEIGERIVAAAERCGLAGRLDRPTPFLSGGQKQQLVLAAITAMRPRILVCDEPLARLDAAAAHTFLQTLRDLQQAGTTIVTAEHRLDEIVPYADRVLRLDGGRPTSIRSVSFASSDRPPQLRPPEVLPSPTRQPAANVVLQGRGLAYRFSGAEDDVWRDVSFAIRRGERIAVVGPNGAGKSTLLAALAGELKPRVGELGWSGNSPARPVVLVPQQIDLTLVESTVGRELAFGPRQCGWSPATIAERTTTAARLLRIEGLVDDLPQALSHGQRVRTAIAAALATAPRLLLLDEPTTGQDLPTMHEIMSALGQCIGVDGGPEALIFSTHDLEIAARYADRVWVVADGRLSADVSSAAFAAAPELQRQACGGGPD